MSLDILTYFCLFFPKMTLTLNSKKGIFKSLQQEFEEQLKSVLAHFHQSDDPKFSLNYLVRKLKELENVHISKSQAHVYLSRIHPMCSPKSRALIKFNSRKTRMLVRILKMAIFR